VKWEKDGEERNVRKEENETIPLPEGFDVEQGDGDEQQWKAEKQLWNEKGSALPRRSMK
jgi:hypothetical protein